MLENIMDALSNPLDAALIERRKVGGSPQPKPYLEGYNAINQANKLFGFNGWSTEVVAVEARTVRRTNTETGEVREAVLLYQATVKVTVEAWGIFKTDVGAGVVTADTGDGHDFAYKTAVTDALKRALRQFGPQFGNDLYDRDGDAATGNAQQGTQQGQQGTERRTPANLPSREQYAALKEQRERLGWSTDELVANIGDPTKMTPDVLGGHINALAQLPTPQPAGAR